MTTTLLFEESFRNLCEIFPYHSEEKIRGTLVENNHLFVPTLQSLSSDKTCANLDSLKGLFPNDDNITKSIIGVVLNQNDGAMDETFDTLFSIKYDNEAIEQLRNMSKEQKNQLAEEESVRRKNVLIEQQARFKMEMESRQFQLEGIKAAYLNEQKLCHEQQSLCLVTREEIRALELGEKACYLDKSICHRLNDDSVLVQNSIEIDEQDVDIGPMNKYCSSQTMCHRAHDELDLQLEKDDITISNLHIGDIGLTKFGMDAILASPNSMIHSKASSLSSTDKKKSLDTTRSSNDDKSLDNPSVHDEKGFNPYFSQSESKLGDVENLISYLQKQLVSVTNLLRYREDQVRVHEEALCEQQQRLDELNAQMEVFVPFDSQASITVRYCQKQAIVSWSYGKDQIPKAKDWIGLFKVGANHSGYRSYFFTDAQSCSSHDIVMQSKPGLYEFRLFLAGSNNDPVACSDRILIGPELKLEADFDETKCFIKLRYNVLSGEVAKSDWIGFYRSDKNSRHSIKHWYCAAGCPNESMINSDGQEIMIPVPRRGGYQYEFRFFHHACGYTPLATSNAIVIEKTDRLQVDVMERNAKNQPTKVEVICHITSVNPSSWDTVALYRKPNAHYECSKYLTVQSLKLEAARSHSHLDMGSDLSGDRKNISAVFYMPRQPGIYYFKYWARHIRSGPIIESSEMIVENFDQLHLIFQQDEHQDQLSGPSSIPLSSNTKLIVQADIHSVLVTTRCWVGIFNVDQSVDTHSYMAYRYLSYPLTSCADIEFVLPLVKGSQYQARFFSPETPKNQPVISSNIVHIS